MTKRSWTQEELLLLKRYYSEVSSEELSKLFNRRSTASIHSKARELVLNGYVRNRWSQEEIDNLVRLYANYSLDEIVELNVFPNRTKYSIKSKILDMGLKKRVTWSSKEDDILVRYYTELSNIDLQRFLPNKSCNTIAGRARQLNLKKGSRQNFRCKFKYNSRFFESPTPSNSYFAGLLAADGCLCSRDFSIKLSLQSRDRFLLDSFAESIEFNGTITSTAYFTFYGLAEMSTLCLYSAHEMFKDLRDNFNIVPRKTHILAPPTLNDNNIFPFLIGFLDGDGSIMITKPNRYGRRYMCISFIGTQKMLMWIKWLFDQMVLPIGGVPPANIHAVKTNRSFTYSVGGNRAYRILKALDAVPVPVKLVRKWSKIQQYEQLVGIVPEEMQTQTEPLVNVGIK